MKLISEKNKNEIGKKLSAIYYIAVHGFGNKNEADLKSTEKILEYVFDIAFIVGGEEFASVDIPAYVMQIEKGELMNDILCI